MVLEKIDLVIIIDWVLNTLYHLDKTLGYATFISDNKDIIALDWSHALEEGIITSNITEEEEENNNNNNILTELMEKFKFKE